MAQSWVRITTVALLGVLVCPSQALVNEALLNAQATCVEYLGISKNRLTQYNISVYPPDRDTMCMIRCAGIMLGFWDDEKGLQVDGIRQFYPNGCDAAAFTQRVLHCAERKVATCSSSDACAKAYYSFRCVLRKQDHPTPGNSVAEKLTPEKFGKAQITCSKILRIPGNHLKLYKQGIFPDDAETRCLFRCLGIRLDLYSDTEGPYLERLHDLFAEHQPLEEFKSRARLCIEANRPLIKDNCTAAYRNLYLCFREHFNAFTLRNRQALLSTGQTCTASQPDPHTEALLYNDDI
ncbi:general odorant-binding protein 45-like [Uranotaenia lowii]|uniref:general odorant-binding protein 45-like n=1 Tax=Uranotaenia lowii TaxID=190385 RepID=UPI002478C5AE|nr:general odorant-binding protein 45-like [Uranotaenia lowii]